MSAPRGSTVELPVFDLNTGPGLEYQPTIGLLLASDAGSLLLQGGVDNAVAPASPQAAFIGGVVTSPLPVFAAGDVSLIHFDTRGRLLVQPRGATITAGANTAVAAGATVALPVPPAGTLAITVQNRTAGAATRVLVRQAGGAAGTGISLASLGTIVFSNAVAALEVENIAGPAATVGIVFEIE